MMNPAEIANIAAVERELWWYRGMQTILQRLLDPIARAEKFERVLEAGCGTGYTGSILRDRYGWNMTLLDYDAGGLAHAREFGLDSLTRGNALALPFRDGSFDALVSLDMLVHVEPGDEDQVTREFARVLRPGGLLVIRAAAFNFLRSNHSKFVHEVQRFTRPQLRASAESAGFRIERATYANSFLLPVAAFKFRIWEPITRQPPSTGVAPVPGWLDALLCAPLRMEAAWIGAGGSLPVGQSLVMIARRVK
jgi:SAM-dependent methyltransferase